VSRGADPALRLVDARAGGDISRVILGGAPPLRGESIAAQCTDFAERYDHLRLKLIRPPHGALHMCPVLLLPPCDPAADLGVIIMESMGYPPISGSNLFCAAAVALEHGLVPCREPETRLTVETPAGLVSVTAQCRSGRCLRVAFENRPARIKARLKTRIDARGRPLAVTIVSAGVDYAVVDARPLAMQLAAADTGALLEAGTTLAQTAQTDFVLFHDEIQAGAPGLCCAVAVFQNPGVICRSPTGTGTSAMLVVAYTQGRIRAGDTLTTRSAGGGEFAGRILAVRDEAGGAVLRTSIAGDVVTGPALTIA